MARPQHVPVRKSTLCGLLRRGEFAFLAVAEICDDPRQNFVQLHGRLIAGQALNLRNIRHPPGHVLKPLLIGPVIRDVNDFRRTAGHLPDALGQRVHRDFPGVADVKDFTHRLRMPRQIGQRARDIPDVAERA
jgi:hypothetical protein